MDFNIVKEWSKPSSFRSQCVASSFTITAEKMVKRFVGSLPIEGDWWHVGVIVGRSGTGKTSIAKRIRFCPKCKHLQMALEDNVDVQCEKCQTKMDVPYIQSFPYNESQVLDDFPVYLETAQITKALCSVGFASPPDWLKPYVHLSQGEKMRVDVARALALKEEFVVFDEFTSVIDRDIAHVACMAIAKSVRKSGKKFIAVTCHYDVLDWLDPDWTFCTDDMSFDKKKEPTRQLSSKSTRYRSKSGICLGNITI